MKYGNPILILALGLLEDNEGDYDEVMNAINEMVLFLISKGKLKKSIVIDDFLYNLEEKPTD